MFTGGISQALGGGGKEGGQKLGPKTYEGIEGEASGTYLFGSKEERMKNGSSPENLLFRG